MAVAQYEANHEVGAMLAHGNFVDGCVMQSGKALGSRDWSSGKTHVL